MKTLIWLCTALAGQNAKIKALIATYGNADGVYEAVDCDPNMQSDLRHKLKSTPFGADLPVGVQVVLAGSEHYPDCFENMSDSPYALFYSGDLSLLNQPIFGLVGTRYADDYGLALTKLYTAHLCQNGGVIAGGIALGVETTAYKTALKVGGKCVAVLPCGISQMTPVQNANLLCNISANGGLVIGEYAPSVPVLQGAYHRRGRILAQLCSCLLVPQCGVEGGVHITAGHCQKLGKRVYAVPARIGSKQTSGTNLLIKRGALLTDSPEDLLPSGQTRAKRPPLHGQKQQILKILRSGVTDSGTLIDLLGLAPQTALQYLSELESENYITCGSDGGYTPLP